MKKKTYHTVVRRVWRYRGGNQNP